MNVMFSDPNYRIKYTKCKNCTTFNVSAANTFLEDIPFDSIDIRLSRKSNREENIVLHQCMTV